MKQILDRHQERLTDDESREIWRALHARIPRTHRRRHVRPLFLSTVAVAGLIVLGGVLVLPLWMVRPGPITAGGDSGDLEAMMLRLKPRGAGSGSTQGQAAGPAAGGAIYLDKAGPVDPEQARRVMAEPLRQEALERQSSLSGPGAASTSRGVAGVRSEETGPISVGGTDPVNDAAFDAQFFEHYGVNPFVDPREDPLATFAVDVDTASYGIARAFLDRGLLPPKEAIRVEEFVNSLAHDYPPPERGRTFSILLDAAPTPFGDGLILLRVGLKGREIDLRGRKPAVLTFVIDTSGSMERADRLELVKASLRLLLGRLGDGDRVGIVTYGDDARVVLSHVSAGERGALERAIQALTPDGSTNAESGLRLAYDLAGDAFDPRAENRIILCSDGVANVGLTGAGSILETIGDEARRGISLTTVGFGLDNYNDVLMEMLADHGDGWYRYVNDLQDADATFAANLGGVRPIIARQTKVQVEFDPSVVRRYRLLGYENRDVADRDFRNDAVDAGEVGAGHEVTALFEVKLEDDHAAGDLAVVRLRFEDPDTGQVTEEQDAISLWEVAASFEEMEASFRLDAAMAEFAEILRGSYWARGASLAPVHAAATAAASERGDRPAEAELLRYLLEALRLAGAEVDIADPPSRD